MEPHSKQVARLVVTYHAMLCVPVEHHTSANAGMHCLLGLSHRTAFGLDADVYYRKEKAANFNVAALRYGQPSLCLEYRQQRPCDGTE